MPGAPDPEYVSARRALLDALEALAEHRDSIIVVGAQAVYLRTGAAELAVAEFTTDADLAIDPTTLRPDPRLDAALTDRGFVADLAQPRHLLEHGRDRSRPDGAGDAGRRRAPRSSLARMAIARRVRHEGWRPRSSTTERSR